MKTKITIIFVLICLHISVFAQKYGNIWEFGNSAGINFNNCDPSAIQNGVNAGTEGCSTVSDANGQLLFYTNSDVVWDKTNTAMPNGTLINSGGSLSQVIIIPKPFSASLYYVVTTSLQGTGPKLQYHTIDMSLNGGLGDVANKNNVITNLQITEQVAATYHADGADIWLMVHEYRTNRFFAYMVSAAGISSTPVISSVGPAHAVCMSGINARGEIKFSPDGHRVAFTANGIGGAGMDSTNIFCVFDFDNTTGIVSNPINLPVGRGDFGLSFSADNTKLYEATWKAMNFSGSDKNYIYQFDLSSGNPTTIANSRYAADSSDADVYGALKLGPDGKIYVARATSDYVGVINAPDRPGSLCNYVSNGFYLGGKTCFFGLNNYIEYSNYCNTSTGINDPDENQKVSIYPNPLSSTATLEFSYTANASYTFVLYNMQGQAVKTIDHIHSGTVQIQKQNLAAGIYFYQLRTDEKMVASGKLVVE